VRETVTRQFAEAAKRYIDWIDSFDVPSDNDLRDLHKLIAELQCAGADLLGLRVDDASDSNGSHESDESVPDPFHGARHSVLVKKLSVLPISAYSKIFQPLQLAEAPVVGWLQDDLADIYLDLRDGLALFESGRTHDALWSWQFSYRSHWGRHAIFAQTAIWEYQP
jgi:hypothetical protein